MSGSFVFFFFFPSSSFFACYFLPIIFHSLHFLLVTQIHLKFFLYFGNNNNSCACTLKLKCLSTYCLARCWPYILELVSCKLCHIPYSVNIPLVRYSPLRHFVHTSGYIPLNMHSSFAMLSFC